MISEQELRKLQLLQLDMLNIVADICNKHNLKYWLDGGTLLGAVRHGGYIPWDDDIDIGLLRKDYNKLLKILPEELPDNLVLQTSKTDKYFKYDWAKVRDRFSEAVSTSNVKPKHKYKGLRIDIFTFDYVPENRILQKTQLLIINTRMFFRNDTGTMQKMTPLKKMVHKIGQILPDFVFNIPYRITIKLSNLLCNKYISCYFQVPNSYPRNLKPTECYFPLSEVTFENIKHKSPANIDCYLKSLFGNNYMTPVKYPVHLKEIKYFDKPQM